MIIYNYEYDIYDIWIILNADWRKLYVYQSLSGGTMSNKKNLSAKRIERVAEYNNIPIGVCEFYKKEFEEYFTMDNLICAFEKCSEQGRWKDSM